MTIERRVVAKAEAELSLAARFRKSAENGWDEERCRAEAEAWLNDAIRRGWRWGEPVMAAPTWKERRTPTEPTLYAAQAREAIRRNSLDHGQTHYVDDDCQPPREGPA